MNHALSKATMEDILSVATMGTLEEDLKIIPSSVHLLWKTIETEDLQHVEYHVRFCRSVYEEVIKTIQSTSG